MEPVSSYRIMKSQLSGIIGCIDKYTSHPHIVSVCDTQKEALEAFDQDTLLYTCKEMLDWYKNNISEIHNNPYVYDAEIHDQNMGRLEIIIQAIEDNPDWFIGNTDNSYGIAESKKKMLFISHSTYDSEYVAYLVDLLRKLGFDERNLFCSSYPGYGIPLGEDIYSFLKSCFIEYDLFVLFVISKDNYYASPASLNEMGAAWVQGAKAIPLLLPEMSPKNLQGVVTPASMSIVLDSDQAKNQLNALKNELILFFELDRINDSAWERDRDSFLENCKAIVPLSLNEIESVENVDENTELDDLISDRVSLETSLYRTLIKAKQNNDKPLQTWIKSELNGYANDEEVPDYRKVTSFSFEYSGFNLMTQVNKAPLPVGFIGDELIKDISQIKYKAGIREIESFSNSGKTVYIDRSFLAGEVSRNSGEAIKCVSISQLIPASFFSAIVAAVKERLIEVLMP